MEKIKRPYHLIMAWLGAVIYRSPSREIKVIAVTGTKGKSTTVELIGAMLESAGKKVALSDTVRFKIGDDSERNLYKMSMPGRLFMQRFLRRAVKAGCSHAVIEMTSQGALNFRHRFIDLDAFVMTNISPEHIEAHGSYEAYVEAKVGILRDMERSRKPVRTLIVNADDAEADRFVACFADRKLSYSIHDVEPYEIMPKGLGFTVNGRPARSPLSGMFNLYNIVAAMTAARNEGASYDQIIKAVESFGGVAGRVERVEAGQDFEVIVDYAHTPDSLKKLYQIWRPEPRAPRAGAKRLIAVLGGTGGGRDTWKRKEMGRLADEYCDEVILTDEDPYDEDPDKIVADVAAGVASKKPIIIMDRRLAVREAVKRAGKGDAILITGKGTDPYIMGPRGTKTPWSDSEVAREELEKLVTGRKAD